MENTKATRRNHFAQLALGGICALLAGLLAWLLTLKFSPFLTMVFTFYFLIGNAKFGPRQPYGPSSFKVALTNAIIWPYLAWKAIERGLGSPSPAIYEVELNGVFVGELSDADYSAIKLRVLRDARTYVAQLLNLGRVLLTALNDLVVGGPILAFWGMLALAYWAPDGYAAVIEVLQRGPAAIREFVATDIPIFLQFWLIVLASQSIAFGRVPGFRNQFSLAVARGLRQHLGVAAEGDLCITPRIRDSELAGLKPV